MDDFFQALLACLGKINPLYAFAALAVYALLGGKLKGLLDKIKLPNLKPVTPDPTPDKPPSAPVDLDKWLEEHPLLDILWRRLKNQFAQQIVHGRVDPEDAMLALSRAIKQTNETGKQ